MFPADSFPPTRKSPRVADQEVRIDQLLSRTVASRANAGVPVYLLGSVRDLVNASGVVIDDIDCAGSEVATERNPYVGDRFTYDGAQYIVAVGLADVNALGQPATVNWAQEDSMGFAAGQDNLYQYVGNNPTNATDPSGLATREEDYPYMNNVTLTTNNTTKWLFSVKGSNNDGKTTYFNVELDTANNLQGTVTGGGVTRKIIYTCKKGNAANVWVITERKGQFTRIVAFNVVPVIPGKVGVAGDNVKALPGADGKMMTTQTQVRDRIQALLDAIIKANKNNPAAAEKELRKQLSDKTIQRDKLKGPTDKRIPSAKLWELVKEWKAYTWEIPPSEKKP